MRRRCGQISKSRIILTYCIPRRATCQVYMVLFCFTFLFILPMVCKDLGYSPYYSYIFKNTEKDAFASGKTRLLLENERRIAEATHFLSRLNASAVLTNFQKLEQQKSIYLAIGIVTVTREFNGKSVGYLTQVASRLIDLFDKDKSLKNNSLFICNVDSGKHADAEHLSTYIPSYKRFTKSGKVYERETMDYVFCMKQALSYNPRYVVIFEDDAVPNMDFFVVLDRLLSSLIKAKSARDVNIQTTPQWAYLKLYFPERLKGFLNSPRYILDMVAFSIILGLGFLLFHRVLTMKWPSWPFCHYLLGCIYFGLLLFSIGRQYLIALRPYTVVDATECCTPAVLYPSDKAEELVNYLLATMADNLPVDQLLDNFIATNNYKRYLVEPNIAKHIGFYSSVHKNIHVDLELLKG